MGPKYSVLYFKENLMQRKNQMNDRLQKMLLKKYALTKNQRYLAWLEQQSQMHISTKTVWHMICLNSLEPMLVLEEI